MTKTTKTRLLGGSSFMPRIPYSPGGFRGQLSGPTITMAPENDGGGGGGGDPPVIDAAAHAALAAAHERLKRDSQADRTALTELKAEVARISAEKDAAEEEKVRATGDVEAVRTQLETKHARELTAANQRADKAEAQVRQLVIENGLSAALDEVKVHPDLKQGALALLREGVELRDENGTPVAYRDGAPLVDAIKTWSGGAQGKAYVLDGNTGGGANGGPKNMAGKNPWKSGTPDFSLTEQDRITRDDPALAMRLKAEAGIA